jgi:DNA-binding NtrC family response regulator
MTSYRKGPAIRAAAPEGGAFAFLVKPFDDEAFLSLFRQALRSATWAVRETARPSLRRQFEPEVILLAVGWYLRFTAFIVLRI